MPAALLFKSVKLILVYHDEGLYDCEGIVGKSDIAINIFTDKMATR